jgi:hypothetical protein
MGTIILTEIKASPKSKHYFRSYVECGSKMVIIMKGGLPGVGGRKGKRWG